MTPLSGCLSGKWAILARVRIETLVLTENILQQAYGPDLPPCLAQTGNLVWTDDYPQEFRKLPALAGYTFQSSEPFATGYFVATERRRYDFHDPSGEKRGLVTTKRDPLGRDTTIAYDQPYHLLRTEVTDPVGLKSQAKYDYRVLQPKQVTEVNDNLTEFSFTPLGLLKETRVKGKKATEGDGDRHSWPSHRTNSRSSSAPSATATTTPKPMSLRPSATGPSPRWSIPMVSGVCCRPALRRKSSPLATASLGMPDCLQIKRPRIRPRWDKRVARRVKTGWW